MQVDGLLYFFEEARSVCSRNIYLILILLIAVALRFYGIQNKGLWADEAYTVSFLSYPWHDLWDHRYLNRPLYFVLLKIWSYFFGMGEFSLRFPSAVLGALSVLPLYRLGSILFDRKTALLAALLLAVSPFHIYWSQEVRNLVPAVFLSLISMCYFFSLIRSAKNSDYVGHAVSSISLFYTHPMGLYLLPVQCLFYLLVPDKKRFFKDCKYWLLLFIATLPIMFLCVNDGGKNAFTWIAKSLAQIFETFNYGGACQAHGQSGFIIPRDLLIIPRTLNVIFLLFFCLGLKGLFEKRISGNTRLTEKYSVFLILWLFLPILVSYFSDFYYPTSFYLLRHTIISLSAYYLILARGLSYARDKKVLMLLLCGILIPMGFALWNYYHLGNNRTSWREAAPYVHEHIQKNDGVIFVPTDQMPPFFYYFSKDTSGQAIAHIDRGGYRVAGGFKHEFVQEDHLFAAVDLFAVKTFIQKDGLGDFVKEKRDVWLVLSPYWLGSDPELVRKYLERSYTEVFRMVVDYNGVEIRHYKLRGTQIEKNPV